MKYALYAHNGSANHGCEAIVRSTVQMLQGEPVLYTANPEQDEKWKLDKVCTLETQGESIRHGSMKHILLKAHSILTGSNQLYYGKLYANVLNEKEDLQCFLSIGGDNYCYTTMPAILGFLNGKLNKNAPTVLWGCSVEPTLCQQLEIVEDLKHYSLITVRESLTYEALAKAGITENVCLVSDPAFTLEPEYVQLPEIFENGRVVGLNISPLILKYGDEKVIIASFKNLIDHILKDTEYNIALIPHVNCDGNSDIEIMKAITRDCDTDRVYLVEEQNCSQMKYIISKCEMFVGARTHATIAAYSSCVPTLTVGYSIKARGIAKDIFGENNRYIIPVQDILKEQLLITEFDKLDANKESVRKYLQDMMPDYINKAYLGRERLEELLCRNH